MKSRHPLARLGGAPAELADVSPRDRTRYGALGGLMLVTATVGGVAMYVLAEIVFHLTWPWAIVPAIAWIGCILTIDRALLVSFPAERSKQMVLPVLWRVLLAFVIGVVVSTPMTLLVFKPEVDVEVQVLKQELRDELHARNDSDPLVARIPDLRAKVADAEHAVSAGGTAALSDPAYVTASQEANALYADWSAKREAYDGELQGTGGSMSRGVGPIASAMKPGVDEARAAYERKQTEADRLLQQATTAGEVATAAAAAALPGLREELQAAVDREEVLIAANEASIVTSDGIHNRIEALFRIAAKSPVGLVVHVFVFLFFLVIELLPVLVKWMLSGRQRTEHAVALEKRDAIVLTRATHEATRAREDEEALTTIANVDREARVEVALDGIDRQRQRQLWENEERDGVERDRAEQELSASRASAMLRGNTVAAESAFEAAWNADPVADEVPVPGTHQDLVGGRYRLVDRRPSGYATEVWKALDIVMSGFPIVAVKMLPSAYPGVDSERWTRVVQSEINAVRHLPVHDNVMRILETGYHAETEQWWFSSPWYGGSLHDRLRGAYLSKDVRDRPTLVEVVEYVRDAALGVAAAHEAGIAHGDIKPANLVKDDISGTVRVIDFGLARTTTTLDQDRSGLAPGTPYYAAPELIHRGDGEYSPLLCDVFGLGAVLYFFISGTLPRRMPSHGEKTSVAAIADQITRGDAFLGALSESLPEELTSLVVRCLAPNPEQRFGTWDPAGAALELARELERMMATWTRATSNTPVGPELVVPGSPDWERRFYDPTATLSEDSTVDRDGGSSMWSPHVDTAVMTQAVWDGGGSTSLADGPTPLAGPDSMPGRGAPIGDIDAAAHDLAPTEPLPEADPVGRSPRWGRKRVGRESRIEDAHDEAATNRGVMVRPAAALPARAEIFDQDDIVDGPGTPTGDSGVVRSVEVHAIPTEPMHTQPAP